MPDQEALERAELDSEEGVEHELPLQERLHVEVAADSFRPFFKALPPPASLVTAAAKQAWQDCVSERFCQVQRLAHDLLVLDDLKLIKVAVTGLFEKELADQGAGHPAMAANYAD